MKIMDRLSRLFARGEGKKNERQGGRTDPTEKYQHSDMELRAHSDFSFSPDHHAADLKRDAQSSTAERLEGLLPCDLPSRSDANPEAKHDSRTPVEMSQAANLTITPHYPSSSACESKETVSLETLEFSPATWNSPKLFHNYSIITTNDESAPFGADLLPKLQVSDSFWNDERIEQLIQLWASGSDTREISDAFGGIAFVALRRKLLSLGLIDLLPSPTEQHLNGGRTSISELVPPSIGADQLEVDKEHRCAAVEQLRPESTGWAEEADKVPHSWTDERGNLLEKMLPEGQSANHVAEEPGGVTTNGVGAQENSLDPVESLRSEPAYPDATRVAANDDGLRHNPLPIQVQSLDLAQIVGSRPEVVDDLGELPDFDAVEEPEDFFARSDRETASGTFVAFLNTVAVGSKEPDSDWDFDLSPGVISGEAISTSPAATDGGATDDFLKVRKSGRQSTKRAVVQSGTRLSIDHGVCLMWAEETLEKGWCSFEDIDRLVTPCDGNGDLEELAFNIQRIVELVGIQLVEQENDHDPGLWDSSSDTSTDDFADAIHAALTRSTRLPGTQRFVINKLDERRLVEHMARAGQDLSLGILASEAAVEEILKVVEMVRAGLRNPGSVSLRTINPSQPGHTDTAEFMASAETLNSWHSSGRVMDGKRRKEALAALEALDLTLAFHRELVRKLEADHAGWKQFAELDKQVLALEAATEHLIRSHLPYARRFASRNVKEGEDPEEVFQEAFIGLQRSTRRYDPERGHRFLIYATFWMRQTIARWRADEGTVIRIPVHRAEKISRIDTAMDNIGLRFDAAVSDEELAVDLACTTEEVRQLRRIPREAIYPESIDDWEKLLPSPDQGNDFDNIETARIMSDALAELHEREAEVLRMRFGIGRDAEMTLEEIGQLHGVTRERIRQIEASALARLSTPGRMRRLRTLLGT